MVKTKVARVDGGILQLVARGNIMEGILFGFFLGALFGGAAAKLVLDMLKNRRAAQFDKLVVEISGVLPDDPANPVNPQDAVGNLLRHNNLDWMRKGDSA